MEKHPHLCQRLFRNNIFRLSLLYFLLLLVASIVMLGVAYVTIEKNIQSSIEKEVNAEISRFIGSYQSDQLGIKTEPYAFFIEQEGRKLAGNIDEIPEKAREHAANLDETADVTNSITPIDANKIAPITANEVPTSIVTELPTLNEAETPPVEEEKAPEPELVHIDAKEVVSTSPALEKKGSILGKAVTLPGRTTIFIGKNSYDETERREDIIDAFVTSLLSLLLVGFIGGLFISFQSIKRIDRISRVSKSIMGGNFSLRIPVSRQNDDISDLGLNINNMLDKIDYLMQTTREVSNNIAHDLRTPLTRLRANIETIARKSGGEIQIEAERALEETDNLLNTFSSLLRISQVESGTAKILRERINLSNLIREVMDFYEALAEEKSQQVRLELEPNVITIGDRSLLSQAVVNLFANAVKYTPEGGNILIKLVAVNKDHMIELIIHDSGNGVPDEEIDKLTRRFYRLEKHRNTANGNGLGLTMVKAIIDAHDGELSFANDVGLKVTIHLPLVNAQRNSKLPI